jgi:uncharacterized protein (UPF0332 family)
LTEENKKQNIEEELAAADKTRSEAELLFQNGFFTGAVSRLYYSLLYRIRALLLTKGLEPKSREGALRLLSLHFVKGGIFETKASHLFSKIMQYRDEADSNPAFLFTREDFIHLLAEVDELSEKTRMLLKEKHYL